MNKFSKMIQGWDDKLQTKGTSLGKVTDSALTALNSISSIAQATKANAQIKDTAQEQSEIDSLYTINTDLGSYDALEQLWGSTNMADTDYSWKDVRGLTGSQIAGNIFNGGLAGAKGGASIGGNFSGKGKLAGGLIGGAIGMISAGMGAAAGTAKAKKEAARLNLEGFQANNQFIDKFEHGARNVAMNSKNNALLNMAAEGGYIPTRDFTNGMTFFSEGGSHEENPYQGVQQGVAPDGKPNLVEEGEWKYKDYIYSKRLKVPKKDYEMLGLKEGKEYTYADAAEAIQKESEERPNDPISIRNLDVMMGRLQNSQESFKQKRDAVKLKKDFEKLSPEEKAYILQAMSQPQQAIPAQAQYAANGGNLAVHKFAGPEESQMYIMPYYPIPMHLSLDLDHQNNSTYVEAFNQRMKRDYPMLQLANPIPMKNLSIETPSIPTLEQLKHQAEVQEEVARQDKVQYKLKKNVNGSDENNDYTAQALRAAPILGSAIGAMSSLFDRPDYSNIERAENMYRQIPMVSPKPIGNKMVYTPMDINYLMTQVGNYNIGNRRAIIESGAGNPGAVANALLTANYKGTTAMGEAFRQANEYNLKEQQLVDEFNRGTDMYNSEADFKGQAQNQARASQIAEAFLRTGQLKDVEKATVQGNRSKALSNLFTSIGDLGTDRLNREMALAMAQSLGVTYNDILNMFSKGTLGGSVRAAGGTLRKKGGKDA